MRFPRSLRARDPAAAARATSHVGVLAAVAVSVAAVIDPHNAAPAAQVLCWTTALVLLLLAWLCRRADARCLDRTGLLLGLPLLAALAVNGGNLLTRDDSVAAVMLLCLPVLLACTQLRRWGAAVVTCTSLTAHGVVTAVLVPAPEGAVTILFVTAAGLTVMLLLVQLLDRQEELVTQLRARADADGLTGVLERRSVDALVDRALARGEVAVLVVDVDHFKQVNDQHGHLVGDDALVHLTRVMRGQLRRTDCTVGRLGGDELVMVLPGCSAAGLALRAEDLVTAVRQAPLPLPGGGVLPLTVSVGGAHAPTDAGDLRGLYAAADAALYRAKRAGRDGFSLAAEQSSSRAGGSGA